MMARETLDVASGHPAFAGHFPGRPVLPGAILLDEVLAILARARALDLANWQLSAAKFLGAITPGETLTVEHDALPGGAVRFSVHAGRDGMLRPVASGTLSARNGVAGDGR